MRFSDAEGTTMQPSSFTLENEPHPDTYFDFPVR